MADVLNRVTKEQFYSVNTPDYSEVDWIINPDLTAVVNVPKKYWKMVGDVVSEMNQSEKDYVDSVELPGVKTERKSFLSAAGINFVISRGYTEDIQKSIQDLYSESLGNRKPNREKYIRNWLKWKDLVEKEVKNKQNAVEEATTITAVNSIDLDYATLESIDPATTLKAALETVDSTSSTVTSFVDANAEVTDATTTMKGPFSLMQSLCHRRDLYNDTDNPLYHASVTPILGANGHLVSQANRILNLENIHAKLGWHNQQLVQATYNRPKDLLIYYGYLNSFNSGVHGWDNEKVAQEMAKYGIIVMGNGVADPTHPDYANTQIIIPRIKALNPNALIFGYVSVNQTIENFQTKVNQCETLQVHGIFMDEAGYDYGKTRAEFNTRVDYVHGKTYAKICFANAWNTDHILGIENDASFPNSTYNPTPVQSKLNSNDWILLESFPINTTAYTASTPDGYETKSDWYVRGEKAKNLRYTYGVNFAGCGIINDGNSEEQNLFNFGFISAMMYNLEGFGTSDTSYGSGSAKTKFISRPDTSKTGIVWNIYPSVKVSVSDSDVYMRYLENAKLALDFSDSAQASSITKY